MVRLKVLSIEHIPAFPEFQFQYGTIKSSLCHREAIPFFRFNSNMVRLKGEYTHVYPIAVIEFQFQYGTIKRD